MPPSEPRFDTVVVRFGGEIGIKADWTRKLYERRLVTNIKAVLKKHALFQAGFTRRFGRLYIKTAQAEETAEKLSKVLGVSSLSPASETTSNLNDILSISVQLASLRFKEGKSFAVRCHRIGKHPYTSQDICRKIGQTLLTGLPKLRLRVDLTHPEQILQVEVREDRAYVFTDTVKGAGGLPLGTQPKLVCLLRGDTPSAVACWMTMKRGCPQVLTYFNDRGSTNEHGFEKALNTAQKLMEWSAGFPRKLYVVERDADFQKLIGKRQPELSKVLCKRLMLSIAQSIAATKKAEGIVTGDQLGRKPGQTLHALRMEDEAAGDYPIYRPLIGLDTQDIEETARKIGLEQTTPYEEKSGPRVKQTQMATIKLEDIHKIEKELDIERTTERAVKSVKVITL